MHSNNLKAIFFILVSCTISCSKSKISGKKFTGYWAETKFEYLFKEKGNFIFKTEGHFGNTLSEGKYSMIDTVVLLYPFTDWNRFHGVLQTRLIYNDQIECLQDFDNRFYCQNIDSINTNILRVEKMNSKIINRLFKVKEVKEKQEEYKEEIKAESNFLRFDYEGIILIDNNQFHSYQLKKKIDFEAPLYRFNENIQYHFYLVSLEKNLIYKHHSREDSLSIVSRLFEN
jgi:hypothetical protein